MKGRAHEAREFAFNIDSRFTKGGLIGIAVVVLLASYFPLKWGFANAAATRVDNLELARFLAEASPSDPQTHFAYAVLLEKSFVPSDLDQALREYEAAASLAPENYLLWLHLGRARERAGDADGAELALRRSLKLAPNYSQVKWSLGNLLVREGRFDDGFAEIRSAVASDTELAQPAVNTSWPILGHDLDAVGTALGDSPPITLALVGLLARENRFDDAMKAWNSLAKMPVSPSLNAAGREFAAKLVSAKRFGDAARVIAELEGEKFVSGNIRNPGFESPLKLQNADIFDWQLTPGSQSQIAPTNGERHGGSNSLVIIFNSAGPGGLPQIAQTVPVEAGRAYQIAAFYRSNLKSSATIRLAIFDAVNQKLLAQTEPASSRVEWTAWKADFTVPSEIDGIVIKLLIDNCAAGCNISGNLWIDDLILGRTQDWR